MSCHEAKGFDRLRYRADEAARRFVRVDAGEAGADAELTAWLAERDENERALERVELTVALGKRLAADPDSAFMPRRREPRARSRADERCGAGSRGAVRWRPCCSSS